MTSLYNPPSLDSSCIFAGDLFGIQGEHTFEPMSQLDDFIKARRYFAYGELHDYWGQCRVFLVL
jgi:hypothetical protein